jgi:hypothetical protein
MGSNENSAVDTIHEAGESYGREVEREIVKDEVLALLDKYIKDLSAGSSLDNPSVRVAVVHLRDVRTKVSNEI